MIDQAGGRNKIFLNDLNLSDMIARKEQTFNLEIVYDNYNDDDFIDGDGIDNAWLPPGPTRIKNWYHSKFQLIPAIFGPLIPKLCSDKSESGGK